MDASTFSGNLSSTDTDVQTALKTIDAINHVAIWNSEKTYAANDFCHYGGKIYKSLADANLNKQPDVSPAYWSEYGGATSGGDTADADYIAYSILYGGL